MYAGFKSSNGDIKWEVGKWFKEKDIKMCERGFHASVNPIHAMGYVPCEILAKVEVRGESIIQNNKQCWSEMKIVKTYDWKKEDSVALAIYAAELVIDIYEKKCSNDKRPREAIEAAKKWLKEPTEENRIAAAHAADDAYAAAHAANAAYYAYAAAHAANAAYAAANAANAAYAAAHAAEKEITDKCAAFVLKRIKAK